MDRKVVVLAEDEAGAILGALDSGAYKISVKNKLSSALKALSGREVVIIGRHFGAGAMNDILAYHPDALVIIISDGCDTEAVIAGGAFDCIEHPPLRHRVSISVRNAFKYLALRSNLHGMKTDRKIPPFLKSRHKDTQRISRLIEEAGAVEDPVLISGERGTGRALVAKIIHAHSLRSNSAFVQAEPVVDGIETELFGRLSGSDLTTGLVHKAEGGTLYLGNIGPVSTELNDRLISLLTRRRFKPEESPAEAMTDARIICSVNGSPLNKGLAAGFPVRIDIPPLRERKDDITHLAEMFLKDAIEEFGTGLKRFSRGSRKFMQEYDWPGNVKELKYAVRKAVLLAQGAQIDERHLGMPGALSHVTMKEFFSEKLSGFIHEMAKGGKSGIYETVISEAEKAIIELALAETQGNQVRASKTLGITRATLRAKVLNYSIKTTSSVKPQKK